MSSKRYTIKDYLPKIYHSYIKENVEVQEKIGYRLTLQAILLCMTQHLLTVASLHGELSPIQYRPYTTHKYVDNSVEIFKLMTKNNFQTVVKMSKTVSINDYLKKIQRKVWNKELTQKLISIQWTTELLYHFQSDICRYIQTDENLSSSIFSFEMILELFQAHNI